MPRDPRMLLADVLEAVIGEALNRLAREDPELVARNPDVGRIVGFRNILAHGYDEVVWKAITIDLPKLVRTVEAMLEELDAGSTGQAQNPSREADA